MSSPSDLKTDPKRDATDSIRGYVYQAYQSILAWMQLKENEILVLEGAEDFDIHCGSSVVTNQVITPAIEHVNFVMQHKQPWDV